MASGWRTQLTKAAGEFLVAAELCRRGYLATTFAGNVQGYDVVALNEVGRSVTIQVKTITGGDWQLSNASTFLDIHDEPDGRQVVHGKIEQTDCIWVFVQLVTQKVPSYYIASVQDVQELVYQGYCANLAKHGGIRPKNPKSRHHAIGLQDLKLYHNRWDIVAAALGEA